MKFLIKVFCLLIAIIMLTTCLIPASAVSYDYSGELSSDTVLMVNMDTGITVYEKNSRERRYPSSLTKIMTYIIVSENIDDFYNTRVTIKQSVLDTISGTGCSTSGVDLKAGQQMTVIDLVHCMIVSSGYDAAVVLADFVGGGDTEAFVRKMNEKAAELGCTDTNFTNPHGLHDPNHYTTAADMYKITSYALTLPLFSEICDTATYYCEGDSYPLTTKNYMIDLNRGGEYFYTYAKGVKNGSSKEAGRCVITTGISDGYAYMCICMNSPYESEKNGAMLDAQNLLRWALLDLELSRMLTTDTPVCEVAVNFSAGDKTITLYPEKNVNTILPKNYDPKNVRVEPDVPESVEAPLAPGDVVGTATVYYMGEAVQSVNLVASENIEKSQASYSLHVMKEIVFSPIFLGALFISVVLIIVYIVLAANVRHTMKQKRVKKYRRM